MTNRPKLLAQDAALVARTAFRAVRDDPLQFFVLANRRLGLLPPPSGPSSPPRDSDQQRVDPRSQAVTRPRLGAVTAVRWLMADRPDEAANVLRSLGTNARPRRLASWLEVHLGMRAANPQDSRRLRARDALERGNLSAAARLAPPRSALKRRILSDLALLAPRSLGGPPAHEPVAPEVRTVPEPVAPEERGTQPVEGQCLVPERVASEERGAQHDEGPPKPLFLLTNSLPYTHSGYTTRSHSMLTALRGAGIDVEAATRLGYPTTVGLAGKPAFRIIDGVKYHRLPTSHLPLASDERVALQAHKLVELARRTKPTVLHTTTDYTNGVVTRLAARELGIPWVYEMRGMLEMTWVASRPVSMREEAASSEKVRLLRDKETELAQDANAVIVLSNEQKRDLASRGVPVSKIHVIPNGIDEALLDTPPISPADARSSLGLPRDGFWVGSVSSLVDYEGFETLLEAIALCRSKGLDVRGALVGHGSAKPQLDEAVVRLGLTDYVVMPGRKDAAEAQRWYQALDAFVLPRKDREVTRVVTPLKPLAAMALGRPVIASDLPALRELLGNAGRLVEPDSAEELAAAIQELAADESLRATLGQQGREVALSRTWQNAAGQCLGIYREVSGGKVR